MKSIRFLMIGLFILGSQAFAAERNTIIECRAMDPAFTVVSVNKVSGSNGMSRFNIVVSKRIDEGLRIEDLYQIATIEKDGIPLRMDAYSSALRKVVQDIEDDKFDGTIIVKSHPLRSKNNFPLFLNFQRLEGDLPDSVVVGGLALKLNCVREP